MNAGVWIERRRIFRSGAVGRCSSICLEQFPWEQLIQNYLASTQITAAFSPPHRLRMRIRFPAFLPARERAGRIFNM